MRNQARKIMSYFVTCIWLALLHNYLWFHKGASYQAEGLRQQGEYHKDHPELHEAIPVHGLFWQEVGGQQEHGGAENLQNIAKLTNQLATVIKKSD